jgi:DNA topoisomerase I
VVATTRPSDQICPVCTAPMVVKRGRFGEFLACSRYPDCKTTSPISLGVACPKPDCGGYLTEKRSKRGKVFFGCSNYSRTKCDFVSWDRPIPEPCPKCGAKFLVKKVNKSGTRIRCLNEDCGYSADGDQPEGSEASETPAPAASA